MPEKAIVDLQEKVKELQDAIRQTQTLIDATRSIIQRWQSYLTGGENREYFYAESFGEALVEGLDEAQRILIKHAKQALAKSEEFSQPFYADGLLEACSKPESISIGRASDSVIVHINLDVTAGSLSLWASAVNSVRKKLIENRPKKALAPASIASKMFAEKYYGVDVRGGKVSRKRKNKKTGETTTTDITDRYKGKYIATIKMRLAEAGALAPWWRILDEGTANVAMSSDRGGESFILTPKTDFVYLAETEITSTISDWFQSQMSKNDRWYRERVRDAEERLYDLYKQLDRLIAQLEKLTPKALKQAIEDQLEKYGKLKDADPDKIDQLARELLAGEVVMRRRLGKGVRIRLTTIMREFRYARVLTSIKIKAGKKRREA